MSPLPHSGDSPDAHEGDRSKAESTFAWFAARREAGEIEDEDDFDDDDEADVVYAPY